MGYICIHSHFYQPPRENRRFEAVELPQNVWSQMRRTAFDEFARRDEQGEPDARSWIEHFKSLGEKLAVRVS